VVFTALLAVPGLHAAGAAGRRTVPYEQPEPPTPPEPPLPRPQGRLVPAEGALFGIHTTPDSPTANGPEDMGIAAMEADFGRTFDIDNKYYAWDAKFPAWRDTWDLENGRIPMISWMGTSTKDTASGRHDDIFGQRADAVKALGQPIFLRWFWEADGERASKKKPAGSPQQYVAAWRHLHDLFQSHGATNAVWVWCPVSLHFYRGTAQPFYPGDDVVDWICADGYNWAPGKPNTPYQSFQSLFEAFYKFGNEHNKPLMVGETGVQENNPGDKTNWIKAMRESVKQHYPNVVAFLYFDVDDSGSNGNYDWRLNSSPEAIAAFKDMALDPYFNQPHTALAP
jgi:Glycosyl hydrolase family 26